MKKVFGIFRIHKDERWMALIVLIILVALNVLAICKYFDKFSLLSKNYHSLFVKNFHISGFDPLTYEAVSQWTTSYNIFRHPLLAFFMYIPYQINQGLIALTGMNCVQFVVAVILIFCALYSFLFLYRIFKEVIELPRIDSILLDALTFSFAYVLVASIVPDHFVMSMFMLILTLYVCGKKMKKNKPLTKWQTILFFLITAGISLNNGIKVFLANLFTNGKHFFRPLNLIFAIMLPALLIWLFARYEYKVFEFPQWHARQIAKQKADKEKKQKIYQMYRDTTETKDSAKVAAGVKKVLRKLAAEKYRKYHSKPGVAHQGKPIMKGEFMGWTDVTTSRMGTMVENLFGESILLHQDYLLGDTLSQRPVIVKYRWAVNYVAEGIIFLLFLAGLWLGRRSRFMWMAVSFFAFDMILHLGLGFGINEIYIMSPHWAFVLTIVMAYLLKAVSEKKRTYLRGLVGCLVAYLFIYNVTLIVEYLV